jgi:hypothetical protein
VYANNFVIGEAEKQGIRSYIFVPCIVCKLLYQFWPIRATVKRIC